MKSKIINIYTFSVYAVLQFLSTCTEEKPASRNDSVSYFTVSGVS